jgi:hypothetical protein
MKEKSNQELFRQNLRCKRELHWTPPKVNCGSLLPNVYRLRFALKATVAT